MHVDVYYINNIYLCIIYVCTFFGRFRWYFGNFGNFGILEHEECLKCRDRVIPCLKVVIALLFLFSFLSFLSFLFLSKKICNAFVSSQIV